MNHHIDLITLGVSDLETARDFYERGFGGAVRAEDEGLTVSLGGSSSPLALREWDDVARHAGVAPATHGFRAFTLSYIVEAADDGDLVLAHTEQHGGRVSKPPKSALWGYSAYVTDPSGYLWKVASTKRRPLLGRGEPGANNGRVVKPQEVPITIGVADMKRSRRFYEETVGLPVKKAFGSKFVMFEGCDGTSDLGMYKREALADDAAVQPDGSGFHGFSLTAVVESPDGVGALVERAASAGATVVKPPTDGGRAYSGCFSDPDGHVWHVTSSAIESRDVR
jgi:catechol 2,3-dioxygenase-like lactoylglutathione lyase family enzyme